MEEDANARDQRAKLGYMLYEVVAGKLNQRYSPVPVKSLADGLGQHRDQANEQPLAYIISYLRYSSLRGQHERRHIWV